MAVKNLELRPVAGDFGQNRAKKLFPDHLGFHGLVETAGSHCNLQTTFVAILETKPWNLTSSALSADSMRYLIAFSESKTKTSVNGAPTSHLSSREMNILKGLDSEYSPEGAHISSCIDN